MIELKNVIVLVEQADGNRLPVKFEFKKMLTPREWTGAVPIVGDEQKTWKCELIGSVD